MTIVEVQPEKLDRNERGKVFELIKACLEVTVVGHLGVIALYKSLGCDLKQSENFETEMKKFFSAEISTLHIKS